MGAPKFMLLFLFLNVLSFRIRADTAPFEDDVIAPDVDVSSLKIELDRHKSKISVLESSIDEKIHELKSKDESTKQMEKLIQEKSDIIASLHGEIESLQKKGSLNSEEQAVKAHARAGELEKQVIKLKEEIETQNKKKEALETRASIAEKKIQELTLKLESLQKINSKQKVRIAKTERALQVAEEEMMKAKLKAASLSKELVEVRRRWLPTWLAVHFDRCQAFMMTQWNVHGKPAWDVVIQKGSEKKTQVGKWAEPHVEAVKTTWIPVIREQWLTFINYIKPHAQSVALKCADVYGQLKSSVTPHVVKVQEVAGPYYQEAKKVTRPYIDQVATVAKPYLDKARLTKNPYSKKVVRTYKKSIKSVYVYHQRVSEVQATILEKLSSHDITKPVATKELVWFLASAVLAAPVFIVYKVFVAIFCNKKPKRTRNANAHINQTRRRTKRVHLDK